LIDDGGVMELWEDVSIVEEDLPTISTLVAADFESEWKLAFERRRNCLKNGMMTMYSGRLVGRKTSLTLEAVAPSGTGTGTGERDRLRRVTTPWSKAPQNPAMRKKNKGVALELISIKLKRSKRG